MTDTIPTSKIKRTISSGKTMAKMGINQLEYIVKKPFMSKEKQAISKEKKAAENARILFNGLSLLRGTALKAAQMLSLEEDYFPKSISKELEKSYNQVPAINRALVRKIITTDFNAPPEKVFEFFDTKAFAAASLGQVHLAKSRKGEELAVKIQYPDIARTISNDIQLLKTLLRPMAEYHIIKIALEEIQQVLLNETDYEKEEQNIRYFSKNIKNDRVLIPETYPNLSTRHVLAMSLMEGQVLNKWLETSPDQKSRNLIAQTLHDIFVEGFYELKQMHADPNPGNFLVTDDLKICLLDFGCVRAFDNNFIDLYQQLIRISAGGEKEAYLELLKRMKLVTPDLDPDIQNQMVLLFMKMGEWLSQLFKEREFDFGANPDFMEQGRQIGRQMHKLKKHIHNITPEFIFIDRTRYGLIKLFEKMKVKIRMKSKYEYCSNS
ncbi:MAG: AarF/ABC1/UbiB kinase family protein [Desulfobacula sp.]|nr:AarF/ABC1/UbiB kinase family protein [Desulfobacula sp.]